MVPLCQDSFASRVLTLCKGWVLGVLLGFSSACTLWAASFSFADPGINCCIPLVTTGITEPINRLIALCHHTVRCAVIFCIVPLSCNQRSLGSQRVMLAHFAAAALRTSPAVAPVVNGRLPAVQVAIWALITYPTHLLVAVRLDVHGAQVGVSSMVPLLLKSWFKAANIWAFLLYMLALRWVTAYFVMLGLGSACATGQPLKLTAGSHLHHE